MDNQALLDYRRDLKADKPIDELLQDANELLRSIQVVKKKQAYVPPYARCKLSCKFHNDWRKNFYSYDYNPREILADEDPTRILDEALGLTDLMELATDYHNAGVLNIATLWVCLEEIPYTGKEHYNFALAQWGARIQTVKRSWRRLDYDEPPQQIKPVFARIQTVLDLDYLADFDLLIDNG